MITQNDIQNYVTTAREEGLEEGRKKGKEEGKKEGAYKNMISTVKKMLQLNADDSFILSATGISKEQLEQLKAE